MLKIFYLFLLLPLVCYGSIQESQLIDHVKKAILLTEKGRSKLQPEILHIEGMSSNKTRWLLNNICAQEGARYLEIGTWKGSTFISALYNNDLEVAIAIDDWSDIGGPRDIFFSNIGKFLPGKKYKFISEDCFSVKLSEIEAPINIYFYDGGHTEIDHEKAFTYFNPCFDNCFIAIVDDWNWDSVKVGTKKAFAKLDYEVLYEVELPARYNGDRELYWNGLYVAVLKKQRSEKASPR